ncbi:MAG: methylated-DNA--[protein]-cysteine S-methyltransferase [Prevotellaceae bacterium]|jgi:methylated-DNA-[protein]-cysteine S-methyltransferase|nr:methylated-DNA--[protein]-cysteine S-methyltransferase [Prevotellaceae bacterium]
MEQKYTVFIKFSANWILINADGQNITTIRFVKAQEVLNENVETPLPAHVEKCIEELKEYFEGKRKKFTFPMKQQGSDFQHKVWNVLMDIPYGEVISYCDLAVRLGNPNIARAVGGANRKNKLWIAVPCHRVIGKNGDLTGYAGGLEIKRWLIEHEQKNR